MSFRVDRNTRCSNSSAAPLSTAPRSAGTSSDWEPSAFETRAESIGMCRKRSFATDGQERRPARAAVCRIPCLILCLAYVERGCQYRAPNALCGVHGLMASVIAALFSHSRPPPPARASYLEHRIRPTVPPGLRRSPESPARITTRGVYPSVCGGARGLHFGLNPVSWTLSERRILCPRWHHHRRLGGPDGSDTGRARCHLSTRCSLDPDGRNW